MTQLSTYGGVIVPSPQDGAVVPADFLAVVNQFCGAPGAPAKVNAIVGSQAERDANYDGYPAGGIVICPPLKTVWMSLGKSTSGQRWQIIYADTGWVSTGFGYGDEWSPTSPDAVKVRRKGPFYTLRVSVTYNGSGNIVADGPTATWPGNIVDKNVITQMPSDFIPSGTIPSSFYSTYTNGDAVLLPSGVMVLRTMNTSSIIAPGQAVAAQFIWPTDD